MEAEEVKKLVKEEIASSKKEDEAAQARAQVKDKRIAELAQQLAKIRYDYLAAEKSVIDAIHALIDEK